MAQIKVKQVNNLQSTLNALTGINTIVETFTTTSINGDTGITITNSAREADAILVYVNGHKIQEGYSWKKDGSAVTADSLEAGTELVWDASVAGYTLDGVDEIQIQYETESGGSVGTSGQSGGSGPAGSSGTSGSSGSSGSAGSTGPTGPTGPAGSSGSSGSSGIDGTSGSSGTSGTAGDMGGTMTSSIIPDTNAQYDLGNAEYKIRHLYLSDSSLHLGDEVISMSAGKINLPQIRINNEFDITTEAALGKATTAAENRRMIDLYNDKIQYACSPVWITKTGEDLYVGSGQWVSLTQDAQGVPTDLGAGYFLTCAHNWFEVVAGQHQIFDQVFVGYNGEWYDLRQEAQLVAYDAVADVMLFRTNIQLHQNRVLKLSTVEPVTGQSVWMCGYPSGYDTDSLTTGIIRDAHFNIRTGEQAVDSLFLNAPGIGGNSGSAILNADGDMIGIYTFGYSDHETFGGGSNLWTLNRTIGKLKAMVDAGQAGAMQDKAFLGMDWKRTIPQEIASRFPVLDTNTQPVYTRPIQQGSQITAVEPGSPAEGVGLAVGMILLSAQAPDGTLYSFGVQNEQRTPGIMIHEQVNQGPWLLEFIDNNNVVKQSQVTWNNYANWPIEKDNYLQGGQQHKVGPDRVQ